MAKAVDAYDAVIIGAGLGGLVCGCYLAKAGMKVLIAEQHFKPGGYCTSFTRGGFTFDAAAHSFGGFRKNGIVRRVLTDLEIDKRLNIKHHDPSDVIMFPDGQITFWADHTKTVSELQIAFPHEKGAIEDFFSFLKNPPPNFFAANRSLTFDRLLQRYFRDGRLHSVLAFPLFGNGGLPPSLLSAFIGVRIYQEFLLDGGYYPGLEMQSLPDTLAEQFRSNGGELRLSCPAEKIAVQDKQVTGVLFSKEEFVSSKYVISNCDARRTFLDLLEAGALEKEFADSLNTKIPSRSMFILYLGLDGSFDGLPAPGINTWFMPDYDLEKAYVSAQNGLLSEVGAMVRVMPHHKSMLAFVNVPYLDKGTWDKQRNLYAEDFLLRIEKEAVANLKSHVVLQLTATPQTLERYTGNYLGAAYGWAGLPEQIALHELRKPYFVEGLYLAGHWATQGLGIPGVIYSGRVTAQTIMRRAKVNSAVVFSPLSAP